MENETLKKVTRKFAYKHKLSRRERDVLYSFADGDFRYEHMANSLGLSQNTIQRHLKSIRFKSGTKGVAEIAIKLLHLACEEKSSPTPFVPV
jgi:DNA-binding CsgD family transcriptional regulator